MSQLEVFMNDYQLVAFSQESPPSFLSPPTDRSTPFDTSRASPRAQLPQPHSHTSSRTWVSPKTKQFRRWRRIKTLIDEHFPHSDVAKWDFDDYVQHTLDKHDASIQFMNKHIAQQQGNSAIGDSEGVSLYGRKALETNSHERHPTTGAMINKGWSAVLGIPTIWTGFWDHPEADVRTLWPCKSEMKYEGVERAKTHCRRKLPLPRLPPSNATVQWYMQPPIMPLAFDHGITFDIIPLDPEDVYLEYDSPLDQDIPKLLNAGLLEAIQEAEQIEW
jgi:hypothetical protein